jgi:hypothetical protein
MRIPSPSEVKEQKVDAVVSQLRQAVAHNQHTVHVCADYPTISDALRKFNSCHERGGVVHQSGINAYQIKLDFVESAEHFEGRVQAILNEIIQGLKLGRLHYQIQSEMFAVDQACRRLQNSGWRTEYHLLRHWTSPELWSIDLRSA